jgi:hypothetical protein
MRCEFALIRTHTNLLVAETPGTLAGNSRKSRLPPRNEVIIILI